MELPRRSFWLLRVARRLCVVVLIALVACGPMAWAAAGVKRARPPKFSKAVSDAFFPNALEKLVGPRPEKPAVGSTPVAVPMPPDGSVPPAAGGTTSGWQPLIAAEVIEDEIKTQQRKLGQTVQNPVKFKAGEYQQARVHLSVLAAMFAIDAEYGQRMRWQREAAGIRDLVARAGFNCKVGTDASYQETKSRFDDLETLVRGGSVEVGTGAGAVSWDKVAGRGPLMKRLEQAQDQGLVPWTASAAEFSRNLGGVTHEAQMIAALASIIQRDGYEYADDETYREYAQSMRAGAQAVRSAVEANDYAAARQAVGEISKTCTNCHEGYRN